MYRQCNVCMLLLAWPLCATAYSMCVLDLAWQTRAKYFLQLYSNAVWPLPMPLLLLCVAAPSSNCHSISNVVDANDDDGDDCDDGDDDDDD